MNKTIEAFMEDTGYTDITSGIGIRKDHRRNSDWTWKDPTEMLKDFIRWQKKQHKETT